MISSTTLRAALEFLVRKFLNGGCSAFPPRAATMEATRFTRLPPR